MFKSVDIFLAKTSILPEAVCCCWSTRPTYSHGRLVVITIFTHVVRLFLPTFQYLTKQNNFQVRLVITTGWTVGLPEWIIDGTHVILKMFYDGLNVQVMIH